VRLTERSRSFELASFDLYDTLVVRRVGPERTIHLLVALAAATDAAIDLGGCPDRYATAREDADREACRDCPAPSLDDIHDRLADALGLDERSSARLRQLELDIELASLVAVPGQVERLAELRSRGLAIAVVSDSHIGSRWLAPRLRELGLLRDGDILVVSSDHGVSKACDGELFDVVVSQSGLPPTAIHHRGDDSWSDWRMARRRRVRATLEPSARLNRYEAMMADADDPSGLAALVAGATRTVRLRAEQRGEPEAVTGVICGVAAPTMIGLALWVASRVQEDRLSHVAFLSRNGRLPMEAFTRLAPAVGCEVSSSYLRISRDAVRLASAGAVGVDRWLRVGHAADAAFLVEFGEELSVARLVEKLGLDPDVDGPIFAEHGLTTEAPLAGQDLQAWRRALADGRILARLRTSADSALDRLGRYLVQEGILGHDQLAMVDIGWTGQQAAMISAAAAAASGTTPTIHHLLLGATRRAPLLVPTRIDSYLFEWDHAPVTNPVGLYELLSATNEAPMSGLRETFDGRIEPVVRHPSMAQCNTVADVLRRLVIEVVEEVADRLRPAHVEAEMRPLLRELAARFWFEPTHDEAVAWGSLPWEVDSSGFIVRTFAEPITMRELPLTLRPGGLTGRQWSSGAVARSCLPIRWLLTEPVRRHSRRMIG
jgi:FMN phosphatase YigB (HAD superfamily)